LNVPPRSISSPSTPSGKFASIHSRANVLLIGLNERVSAWPAILRHRILNRTSIGLDYFDASINRVAAWVIGIRATQKALLLALLEPTNLLRVAEQSGNHTARLALLEEAKSLPWGAVWDEFCRRHGVPVGAAWLTEAEAYGQEATRLRS
jgi:L-rhamnose isomerase